MPLKLFGSRNPNPNPNPNPNFTAGEKPLIVQIIHAGGIVERYYMAFPASWIIEKYPKFVLTRPEIFQRPWDSIVGPEEILVPGKKYFVVPILTVKKLRRRMMKSATEMSETKPKPKPVTPRVCFKGVESEDIKGKKKNNKKSSSVNGKGLRMKNVRFSPALTIIDGRT